MDERRVRNRICNASSICSDRSPSSKETIHSEFGGDFRRLSPVIDLRASEENVLFDGVDQALTGVASRINHLRFADRQNPVFKSLSLFAQDEWRQIYTTDTDLRRALGTRTSAINRRSIRSGPGR